MCCTLDFYTANNGLLLLIVARTTGLPRNSIDEIQGYFNDLFAIFKDVVIQQSITPSHWIQGFQGFFQGCGNPGTSIGVIFMPT